ncbi:hypothetical protein [Pseudocolwellia agarivorans]|uniref:hypothetical protein n=1 Tax=Pseudocolwellia agarivorans TaxID=1911682 RepID=UPI0009873717|nr:hypothetical protein [Pseudocolwellia agarivorans]
MELVTSVWHVFSAFIIFLLGILVAFSLGKKLQLKTELSLLLYLWHTVMCFVYVAYASKNPADANRYFKSENLDFAHFSLGTHAIELFTNILKLFDLSYLGCFLVFNIIGIIGLLTFSATLQGLTEKSKPRIKWFALIIIFLPSVSFWSSAIGKDAFSFMATGLALWASLNIKQRKTILVIAILSMLLVRPHMAGIMVIAISVAIMFDKNANIQIKTVLAVLSSITMVFLIPFALNYAGVGDNVSADGLQDYLSKKQGHNMAGGSSLDISSMSVPMKMFTYTFRPLPFEAHNITALLASIDNVLLLLLFVVGMRHLRNTHVKQDPSNRIFMWAYGIGSLIILSLTTANLGIAMRQKWMFLPMLIYLFMSAVVFATERQEKN